MKRNIIRTFIIVLILSTLSTSIMTAKATNIESDSFRASRYISSYAAQITTGSNGKILVDCSVTGTDIMDTIGVQTLVIQKYQFGTWVNAATWTSLYNYGCPSCSVTSTFNGSIGTQYRAVITFYAELNGGSDSRIMTTNNATAVN
jgi:hypothetical protein